MTWPSMVQCPKCSAQNLPDSRFCSSCAEPLGSPSHMPTAEGPAAEWPKAPANAPPVGGGAFGAANAGGFTPGSVLAQRYRVLGLLGRGGMGEVYRADDLKLGQPVALKFLSALAHEPTNRERLYAEVRIARQVTHPNVCRIHDIVEFDKHHFITMEFIDGEDLASLLQRIGGLHGAKALDISRQLCAGLAAAHDKGVLHRDLKPANVMIDGRGRVRITDFGLAISATENPRGPAALCGTPAYMAPEQFLGKEASVRSDLYALGTVLYELYTGRRAFPATVLPELVEQKKRGLPAPVSLIAPDVDPVVERVISRCLEVDAGQRPESAAHVLAALPGPGALGAAIAAGITPPPETVAAAGEGSRVTPARAVASFAAVILGLFLLMYLGGKANWAALLVREGSPQFLAARAGDIINRLGHSDFQVDSAFGLAYDTELIKSMRVGGAPRSGRPYLIRGRPAALYFWYRQIPRSVERQSFFDFGTVNETSPPLLQSGMVAIRIDPRGRLLAFTAVPPQLEKAGAPAAAADWDALFAAAGLDKMLFTPVDPHWTPPVAFDTRAAWTGAFPEQPEVPLRVEAAAYHGKPVYFDTIGPWTKPARMAGEPTTPGQLSLQIFSVLLLFTFIVGSVLLARYNVRRGRGNRQGARSLALFWVITDMLRWSFGANHTISLAEAGSFLWAAITASLAGGLIYLTYLACEPFVRKRWPVVMISWSRILTGKIRDPVVGRDVSAGILSGIGLMLLQQAVALALIRTGGAPTLSSFDSWLRVRNFISYGLLGSLESSISSALFVVLLIFLLNVLTRRQWLAILLFVAIFTGAMSFTMDGPVLVMVPWACFVCALLVFVLLRCGLVSLAATLFTAKLLDSVPISTDFSAWYGGSTLFVLSMIVAIAACASYVSLGGQPLLRGKFLEE